MPQTVNLEGDFEVWYGAAEPIKAGKAPAASKRQDNITLPPDGSVRLTAGQLEALAQRAASTVAEWRRKADAYDALMARARTVPVTRLAAARALDAKVQAVMGKNDGMTYEAALLRVAETDPAAWAAYQNAGK